MKIYYPPSYARKLWPDRHGNKQHIGKVVNSLSEKKLSYLWRKNFVFDKIILNTFSNSMRRAKMFDKFDLKRFNKIFSVPLEGKTE